MRDAGARRAVCCVALSLALAGCGSKSDREQVTSVAHRYIAALASGNGDQACSLLTGEAQRRLARGPVGLNRIRCPEVVKLAHSLLGADEIAALKKADVSLASLSGNAATVRTNTGGRTGEIHLAKTAAGWLVTKPSKLAALHRALGATGEAPARERPSGEGPPGFVRERFSEYESQLAAGRVREVTINKRLRTVRVTLSDGRHMLAHYAAHQEPRVVAQLRAKGVPVTILSRAQAIGEAAVERSE